MICDECETVAHCLKNGCVPEHQALDRMAENARELGLDYEPVQKQIAGFDVVLDKGMPPNTMKFVQPAPVQEPVGNWIWSWLMDWCKRNGIAPATKDSLFAMVSDARSKFESSPPAAQPAPVQEPVAWMWKDMRGQDVVSLFEPRLNPIPLYTTPPNVATPLAAQRQWVGLTDEYVEECVKRCRSADGLARAIEAKLKEKNSD
jgi:hypothetical protein